MSNHRARVAAYKEAVGTTGATEIRMPMSTLDALELAQELNADDLRHAEKVGNAVAEFATLPAEPAEFEARLVHMKAMKDLTDKFWDAFEGQPVDGVEIIRRRA